MSTAAKAVQMIEQIDVSDGIDADDVCESLGGEYHPQCARRSAGCYTFGDGSAVVIRRIASIGHRSVRAFDSADALRAAGYVTPSIERWLHSEDDHLGAHALRLRSELLLGLTSDSRPAEPATRLERWRSGQPVSATA